MADERFQRDIQHAPSSAVMRRLVEKQREEDEYRRELAAFTEQQGLEPNALKRGMSRGFGWADRMWGEAADVVAGPGEMQATRAGAEEPEPLPRTAIGRVADHLKMRGRVLEGYATEQRPEDTDWLDTTGELIGAAPGVIAGATPFFKRGATAGFTGLGYLEGRPRGEGLEEAAKGFALGKAFKWTEKMSRVARAVGVGGTALAIGEGQNPLEAAILAGIAAIPGTKGARELFIRDVRRIRARKDLTEAEKAENISAMNERFYAKAEPVAPKPEGGGGSGSQQPPGTPPPRAGGAAAAPDLPPGAPPGTRAFPGRGGPSGSDRAANINLDKFDSPERIKEIWRETARVRSKEIEHARRGKVSWQEAEETARQSKLRHERVARQMGTTPAELVRKRRGQAYSDSEMMEVEEMLMEGAANVDASHAAWKASPSAESRAVLHEAIVQNTSLMETLAGAEAEGGRALRALARMKKAKQRAKAIDEIVTQAGGAERIDEIGQMLSDLPRELPRLSQAHVQATTMEQLAEAYKAMLLYGPQTHAANFLGNSGMFFLNTTEKGLSAAGRRVAGGRGAMADFGYRLLGNAEGFKGGMRLALDALRKEDAPFEYMRAYETSRRTGAIQGPAWDAKVAGMEIKTPGELVRFSFRTLGAMDQFFRTISQQGELYSLATRRGLRRGLTGPQLEDFVRETVSKPPAEMLEMADRHASQMVFQRELGQSGKALQRALREIPALGFVVPYFRTPVNLIKEALFRTPLGALPLKSIRAEWNAGAGSTARADLIARVGVGSAMMGWVAKMTADGDMTGSGPRNASERAAWLANNMQPFSKKIDGEWVSYARLEPVATMFGLASDAVSLHSGLSPEERETLLGHIPLLIAQNVTSKTYLRGLAEFTAAATAPERYGGSWVKRTGSSLIMPFGTLTGTIAKELDPYARDTRDIWDHMQSKLPGLRQMLPPKISPVTGESTRYEGSVGPDWLSPAYLKTATEDPVAQQMVGLKMGIGRPKRSMEIDGETVQLTDIEYEYLARAGGRDGYSEALRAIRGGNAWTTGTPAEEKETILRRGYDAAREVARTDIRHSRGGDRIRRLVMRQRRNEQKRREAVGE